MYRFSNQSYKRLNRDRGVGSYYFKDFFESKFFPPKNLDKYEQLKDACVKYYSVSNICSNVVNFPAKKLRKNTVLKIRMRRFFFFKKYIYCQ